MNPVTHLLISWSAASCFKIDKKDRILATIAGVIPDMDGIGIGFDIVTDFCHLFTIVPYLSAEA